jgi:hypothetical protein
VRSSSTSQLSSECIYLRRRISCKSQA